jgi:hypothetical protein
LGCTFFDSKKRWRNIEIGDEIIEIIEKMKKVKIELRPSIDQILEKLIKYCDEKNYSNSIDIIPFLKENKIFIQTPLNENLSNLKK